MLGCLFQTHPGQGQDSLVLQWAKQAIATQTPSSAFPPQHYGRCPEKEGSRSKWLVICKEHSLSGLNERSHRRVRQSLTEAPPLKELELVVGLRGQWGCDQQEQLWW